MLHGARGPSSITTTTISTTTRTQTSTTSSSTTSSTSRSTTTTTTEPREVLKLATILQPMDEAEEAYELRIDDGRERQRFWGSFNSVDAGGRSRLYQLPRHLGLKTCPEDVAVLKASLRNSTMARREDKSSLRSDATCTPNLCHRSLDQTVGLKWLNILLLGYLSQCFVSHALKRTGLGWLWTFGIQQPGVRSLHITAESEEVRHTCGVPKHLTTIGETQKHSNVTHLMYRPLVATRIFAGAHIV